ncbi:hypothetical protein SDC9_198902 [bioreactor metagenome]|uniref:Uncharacterized protein n=1 Tax=bioreactor metagenome TaxID=1076179 RepID=A0A645ILB5_9ZZZZ
MGEEAVALEHGRSIPLVWGKHGHFLIADVDLSLSGKLESCNHPQGGGFAATGGTKQGHQLSRFDDEV